MARKASRAPPNAILNAGIYYGIIEGMKSERKVTVHLPEDLLKRAQESTGKGLTETIRQGLQLLAAKQAYAALREMRGKYKFSLDLKTLRDDRE